MFFFPLERFLHVRMSSISLTCEYFPQLWTAAEADLLNVIINPILLFIFTQLTLSLDLYLLDWVKDDVFCSFEKFGL